MCEGWCGGVTSRHLETEAPTIRASQSAAYMVHLLYWLCSASIRAPCSVVQLVSLGGYRCKPLVCTPLCRTNSLTAALLCRLSHQGSSLAAVTPHLPLACPLFCLRTHPVALHLSSFSCLLSVCDFFRFRQCPSLLVSEDSPTRHRCHVLSWHFRCTFGRAPAHKKTGHPHAGANRHRESERWPRSVHGR